MTPPTTTGAPSETHLNTATENVPQAQAAAARILATTSVAECFTGALQRATDTAASIGMDRAVQMPAVGPLLFGE